MTDDATVPATDQEDRSDERDWRRTAYLTKANWPAAIPPMGPKREHGPYPWSDPAHDNPYGVDDYPHTHPNAASVGPEYMGDVCPYCGVPLSWAAEVVLITGEEGVFHEVDDVDDPTPAYHPECWQDRQAEIRRHENESLDAVPDGGRPTTTAAGVSHEQRARDLLREARAAHSKQMRVDLKRAARAEAAMIDDPDRRDRLLEAVRRV